jgi:hypothetical protein
MRLTREIHDEISKIVELASRERFSHIVREHIISWTVYHFDLVSSNEVGDVKVFYVQMASPFSRACFAVVLQSHGDCIVLIYDIQFHFETLIFNKTFGP